MGGPEHTVSREWTFERTTGSDAAGSSDSELPPSLHYQLVWAEPSYVPTLIAKMRAAKRQTMNLRLTPTAEVILLKDLLLDEVVGWCGFDHRHDRSFAEVFSLYLEPAYRSYNIGLLLEAARASCLLSRGVHRPLARMEVESNSQLLRYRTSHNLLLSVDSARLPERFLERCGDCELFGHECGAQAFFEVDIEAYLTRGRERLGPVEFEPFPREYTLDPKVFRRKRRPVRDEGPDRPPTF